MQILQSGPDKSTLGKYLRIRVEVQPAWNGYVVRVWQHCGPDDAYCRPTSFVYGALFEALNKIADLLEPPLEVSRETLPG